MKIIEIYNEEFPPDPCDDGEWEVKSFNRRHAHRVDPDSFRDDDGNLSAEMRTKLEKGEAFVLDYYEHGNCQWSLSGTGPQCEWDTSRVAGFLIASHVKDLPASLKERRELAASFLERYTAWCNGAIYSAEIKNAYGEKIESFYAFSDSKDLFAEFGPYVAPGEKVVFVGNAKWLADYDKISPSAAEAHEPKDVRVTKAVMQAVDDGSADESEALRDLLVEAIYFAKRQGIDFEKVIKEASVIVQEK